MRPAFSPQKIHLQYAAATISTGGIVAYPTEAVYGLGCHPDSFSAVARILTLKQRPINAGLIIISDDAEKLAPWINPTASELNKLDGPSANPITWIVTARHDAPDWLTGGRPRIAVRLTTHPFAAALCAEIQAPLVSTSANRRGRRPARNSLQVRRWFGAELDYVVPGTTSQKLPPSQIRDARTNETLRA